MVGIGWGTWNIQRLYWLGLKRSSVGYSSLIKGSIRTPTKKCKPFEALLRIYIANLSQIKKGTDPKTRRN